jgi:hypothetical protein
VLDVLIVMLVALLQTLLGDIQREMELVYAQVSRSNGALTMRSCCAHAQAYTGGHRTNAMDALRVPEGQGDIGYACFGCSVQI